MREVIDLCSHEEITYISNLYGFRPYDTLVVLVERIMKEESDKIISNPVFDQVNMKRDIRHKLGTIQGMKNVLDLVTECREAFNGGR